MGVIDQTYTAKNIIERFTGRAYFDGYVIASEVEMLFKPDIAIIDRQHKLNEYEIKVSLSDLRKELDYIDFAMCDHESGVDLSLDYWDPDLTVDERMARMASLNDAVYKKYRRSDNKYIKHRLYLFNEHSKYVRGGRPNRFYFILPSYLYEAEKERIDAIPYYGVIDAQGFSSLKRCKPIHSEPVDPHALWQVALNLTGRLRHRA